MAKKNTPQKTSSSITRKEYIYAIGEGTKDEVSLRFTLRQDTPDEMVKFLMLVTSANAEVQEDLKRLQVERKK